MKKILSIVALAGALGGCAAMNSATAWLSSPQTAKAADTLRSGAIAFSCDIANSAALAAKIETAVKANQAVIDATGAVYTVSSAVCVGLGGVTRGIVVMQ
jgi:hypothetical protein